MAKGRFSKKIKNKKDIKKILILGGFGLFVLLIILLSSKIKSAITYNLRAQTIGCKCDFGQACFNGENGNLAFAGMGPDNELKCCYGSYTDPLYGQFATSKYSFPHYETVMDDKCNKTAPPPASEETQASANENCVPKILNYKNCSNRSLYLLNNPDYIEGADMAKTLGYFYDINCTIKFDLQNCNPVVQPTITPSPTMTPTPTPSVMIFTAKAKFSRPLSSGSNPTMAINFYGPFSPATGYFGSVDKRTYIQGLGLNKCSYDGTTGVYDQKSGSYLFKIEVPLDCKAKVFDHFGDYQDGKYSCQLLTYGESHFFSSPLRKIATCMDGAELDFGTVDP